MANIHNYSKDDRLIKYNKLASLEYLARARCAMNLIDYKEIGYLFALKCKSNDEKRTYSNYFMAKILKLPIPNSVREKLTRTVYNVADQLNDWIRYHDEEIFNVANEIHPIASKHLEAIVWTCLGTIDYLTSARNLMRRNFEDDTKFRIAYAYGLYDYMAELSGKLLQNSNYLNSMFPKHERGLLQRERSALYYWIRYILSDTSEIENAYGYGIRSYLRIEMLFFNVFAPMPNYVLIKCIWNELTTAEKLNGILDLVTTNVSSDLQLYLISQLNAEEQRWVIHSRVPYIYKTLVNDSYVRSFHDQLIDYIWDIMTYQDFTQIIRQLLRSINNINDVNRNSCKQIFKDLWSFSSITFRYQALEHHYKKTTLLPYEWINNQDIVEMVLKDATTVQCKHYLKTNSSIVYAIQMIKKGKYATVESFVKQFLTERDDILEYKANVIQGNNYELIKHFYEINHHTTKHFYRWCFESKSRMNRFFVERRENILHNMSDFFATKENIYKLEPFLEWCLLSSSERARWLKKFRHETWNKLIKLHAKISLIEVEYFLDWSFKTTNKLFKSEFIIPSHTSLFAKYVCVLIKENKLKLLNDLLNWCFLYDQQSIRQFKIYFQEYCEISDFVDVIKSVVILRNDFRTFNNFFGAWYANEKDFKTFRLKIGLPKIASPIIAEFISMNKLVMGHNFFKMCFKFNDKQMAKFKLNIFADGCIRDIIKHKSRKFVDDFIEWVDPPVEHYLAFEDEVLRYINLEQK